MRNTPRGGLLKRRNFIRSGLSLGALGVASSCSSLRKLFTLERVDLQDAVVIVGGGAAGLMAAYELKKKNVPYKIFEAGTRFGGRIYSLAPFEGDTETQLTLNELKGSAGYGRGRPTDRRFQVYELGAEAFESHHKIVFELARELKIKTLEIEGEPGSDFFALVTSRGSPKSSRSVWNSRDLKNQLAEAQARLIQLQLKMKATMGFGSDPHFLESPEAQALDQITPRELLQRNSLDWNPVQEQYFEALCIKRVGDGLDSVSALAWLLSLEKQMEPKSRHRIQGGFSQITNSLFDRVQGVIPHFRMRFQAPLVEIRRAEDGFDLTFRGLRGLETYKSRFVILALPLQQLKKIRGLRELGIPDVKLRAIQALQGASSQKAQWLLEDSPLSGSGGYRESYEVLGRLWTWDATWPKDRLKQTLWSLEARNFQGEVSSKHFEQHLNALYPGIQNKLMEPPTFYDWNNRKHIEGDFPLYRPGTFSQFSPKIWTADFGGRLHWAGEFTHGDLFGTVAGALESGRRAAHEVISVTGLLNSSADWRRPGSQDQISSS